MMLNELEIGNYAVVKKIVAKEPIKSRLKSLGITKGAKVKILDHTLAKGTWEIECDETKVALRDEEIREILVGVEK